MAYGVMEKQSMPGHMAIPSFRNATSLLPDQALALDFVLGVLRAPLLNQAKDRLIDDAVFRDLVDGYRAVLDSLVSPAVTGREAAASEPPSPDVWAAIEARVTKSANG
jgi:anti-sigma-K factor RskA